MPDAPISEIAETIDSHLQHGNVQAALELARSGREVHPESLEISIRLGVALAAAGARQDAIAVLEETHGIALGECAPTETLIFAKHSLAYALNGARQFARSAPLLREALELGGRNPNMLAAAVKAFYRTGEIEEARRWGGEALKERDAEVDAAGKTFESLNAVRPRQFDPARRKHNIIAYSLFGEDRYYHDCAIVNARIAMASYPDFTPRYYCGEEVPKIVLDELVLQKADVKIVKNRVSPWEGLFWRFWAFDDPEVDVVLVRDVDSPLTPRERIAVEDWLYNSDTPFHVMRDHPLHCTPMMAGLWGGFAGLLPPMKPLTRRFLGQVSNRYADQTLLQFIVWPRIREIALAHDSQFDLRNSRDFPAWGRVTNGVHVGWSWPLSRGKLERTDFLGSVTPH